MRFATAGILVYLICFESLTNTWVRRERYPESFQLLAHLEGETPGVDPFATK